MLCNPQSDRYCGSYCGYQSQGAEWYKVEVLWKLTGHLFDEGSAVNPQEHSDLISGLQLVVTVDIHQALFDFRR